MPTPDNEKSMTVEQLAEKETDLYSIVLDLNKEKQSLETLEKLKNIFISYRQIHRLYANIADKQEEALKRGLFIQWYAITEPADLTGISELDEEAELNIIKILENKIQTESLDSELKWMLNYYASWDYVFDRFKNFEGLKNFVQNRTEGYFPSVIDHLSMKTRGQMGKYWNSLNVLKNENAKK